MENKEKSLERYNSALQKSPGITGKIADFYQTTPATYRVSDLIDLVRLNELLEYFYKTTGISNALMGPDGTIFIAIGWQDICTKFHRNQTETRMKCMQSDLYIKNHLGENPYAVYQCGNGLMNVAIPVLVEGEHIATLYIGQFLFEKPDMEYFRKQAEEKGFDWPRYRESLLKVPIYTHDEIDAAIQYSLKFIQMFAELGFRQKKLLELNAQLDQANMSLNQKIAELQQARDAFVKLNESLELRVKERTADLVAANKELEAFSYSVSHDLRTPIRSIDGFGRLLEDEYGDILGEEGKDYLRRVREATRRMGQLIDDLLSLSHVARRDMNRKKVNLSQMARTIADNFIKMEMERSVEFIIASDMHIQADETMMQIVMENLLGNAWKFTRKKVHARIEVGTLRQDGRTVYYVRDNGVGFDMAYVNKLFKAFQRLHTLQDFEGTGIGLATVARIIHRHGGQIWAEGKINHGATFYFSFDHAETGELNSLK